MVELLQLLVGGIAQGCVYGLIALGFVLIYKATEMVNFAQGDLMMLGSFVALTFIGTMGMNYWMGLLVAALAMAVFGYLLDAIVLRRIIGQPQFAVVILTISLGFLFRSFAGFIWGHETQNFPETPFTNRIINAGGVILSLGAPLHHRRHADPGGAAVPVLQLHQARQCHAGGLAEPARGLLHGHAGQAHQLADLGAVGHRRHHRRRAVRAHLAGRAQQRLLRHQGIRGRRDRRLRQPARHGARRAHHRRVGDAGRALPAARLQGDRRLSAHAGAC